MKKWLAIFLLSIFSLIGLLFVPTPVFADPITNPDDTSVIEDVENEEESTEESSTCYDQLGGISWLICPVTNTLASGIDWLYSGIRSFLDVKTISTDTNSPIYLIWEYMRNLTNIVFIIFILVIIYSQLTGFGISNYGIKRTLPRIIIIAILVNLSFLICALAVDVSNILGSSLNHVFINIKDSVIAASPSTSPFLNDLSVGEITATLLGTAGVGTVGAVAGISATVGIGGVIWMLIPVIFSGIIAVLTAFITIAARQALITLLIMIAPLAFVAYLLPNTEKWANAWKDMLIRMLIFYPMFSVLFGASQLAGWAIISSSTNWLGIILGIAVQILPLFMSFSLLKMSGTIPGKVGELFTKATSPVQKGVKSWSTTRSNLAKAEHAARSLQKSPYRLASFLANRRATINDRQQRADKSNVLLTSEYLNAEKLGRKIIGRNKDGTPIYSKNTRANKAMLDEYAHRELTLRAKNTENNVNRHMGAIGAYSKSNNLKGGIANQIEHLSNLQAKNYETSMTTQRAIARNDLRDKRYYFEEVRKASKLDPNSARYRELIVEAAGADAVDANIKIRSDAIMSTSANAYEMFEKERGAITSQYTTFLSTQLTDDLLGKYYPEFLETQNIDGILAMHTILDKRGDHDAIRKNLLKNMDDPNKNFLMLGEDFTSRLALSLLSMGKADPFLGRLGKHINKQTWAYTSKAGQADQRPQKVTALEYVAGIMDNGKKLERDGLTRLISGTPLTEIDRNAIGNVVESIDFIQDNYPSLIDPSTGSQYDFEQLKTKTLQNMMPQIISALPMFESGGEQIRSVLKLFTDGAKFNEDTNQWSGTTSKIGQQFTELYLTGLTADKLISFKTDVFGAVKHTLIQQYGNEAKAKAKFKEIQIKNGNLSTLQNGDPSALRTMKQSVKEWLDL